MPSNIDIGSSAIDRPLYWTSGNWTRIVKGNPANYSGKLTKIYVYAHSAMYGVEFATFYQGAANVFSTRDTVAIGTIPTGYSEHTVNLTVEVGDFLGMHYTSGEIELTGIGQGEVGVWKLNADGIPCTDTTFEFVADCAISLYGTGTTIAPTVTTQAVTDILSITATGNGNITHTGGENPTKRGICWNTTGSPTVADNKSEEVGSFGTGAFTRPITGLSPGVKYYVKAYAYNTSGYSYGAEVDFTTDKVAPTVTTQDTTDRLTTTAIAHGTITASGGENSTVRGFKYGLTKTDTWSASDSGSFGLGAFTKGLTGLTANTAYWIRAYATNSIGTGYGEWIQFQTAASGVIPTGTNLFIAADLAGYSFQLMKSETDDGYPYTAYFVISTDLTNKQGLAYYKRILDLHLYFRSESSGTATIEVKRDNEADWQTVGTVSLTGTADIVIPHLAPDIRAKHFLFKISAQNFFRCLGILFEYLPEDLR